MFDVQVGIPTVSEIESIERWRLAFKDGLLELPNNSYSGDGIATAVARDATGARLINSLTGSIVTAIDLGVLVNNPDAGRLETLAGLFAITRALEYQATLNGAVASYMAIPDVLPEYQKLVTKCGFTQTAEFCKLYRHSFPRP